MTAEWSREVEPVACEAVCSHGSRCTLTKGHRSDHKVIGATALTRGQTFCHWPLVASDPVGEIHRVRWVTPWVEEQDK